MTNITEQIAAIKSELETPDLNPQRRRHIVHELASLERYKQNHPEAEVAPTSLQLYCDEHPDALECRIYNV